MGMASVASETYWGAALIRPFQLVMDLMDQDNVDESPRYLVLDAYARY
jgi:hypothetical protein